MAKRVKIVKVISKIDPKKLAGKYVIAKEAIKGVLGKNKKALMISGAVAGAAALGLGAKKLLKKKCGANQYFNKVTKSCVSRKK